MVLKLITIKKRINIMKFEFNENRQNTRISLMPETPEETAQLLRFIQSSRAEKPEMQIYFGNDKPKCSLWFRKVKEEMQKDYLRK